MMAYSEDGSWHPKCVNGFKKTKRKLLNASRKKLRTKMRVLTRKPKTNLLIQNSMRNLNRPIKRSLKRQSSLSSLECLQHSLQEMHQRREAHYSSWKKPLLSQWMVVNNKLRKKSHWTGERRWSIGDKFKHLRVLSNHLQKRRRSCSIQLSLQSWLISKLPWISKKSERLSRLLSLMQPRELQVSRFSQT